MHFMELKFFNICKKKFRLSNLIDLITYPMFFHIYHCKLNKKNDICRLVLKFDIFPDQ